MISISPLTLALVGTMLAVLSALAGMAVRWGTQRAQVEQLQKVADELRDDVKALREEIGELRTIIAEMRGRASGIADTARHQAQS